MNLQEIRQGIGLLLEDIEGCSVYDSIPEALKASGVTALVIAPGDPYVQYTEGAGRINENEVRMRVVVVPPQQSGARNIMDEIDALLSCGTTEPRSIRSTLGASVSANGTACALSILQAQVRTITINDFANVVGEVDLKILARC